MDGPIQCVRLTGKVQEQLRREQLIGILNEYHSSGRTAEQLQVVFTEELMSNNKTVQHDFERHFRAQIVDVETLVRALPDVLMVSCSFM